MILKRDYFYKGINIGPISNKFFVGQFINNSSFINEIDSEGVDLAVEQYILRGSRNKNIIARIKEFAIDFVRWFYYLFFSTYETSDVYFFISNIKFVRFFDEIRLGLDKENKKYAYIFWDKKDIPADFPYKTIILQPSIPNLFEKINKPNHLLFNVVDRFLSTAKKITGSKILIPEGCLASMHIIGELGKSFNYETICIQWGFFGKSVTKAGWRDMPYDRFLVWGDFFKDQFEKYNSLRMIPAGHPNINIENKTSDKSYVLFTIQKELGDHILLKDLVCVLKQIFELAKNLPQVHFILRTHPDLPFEQLPLKPSDEIQNLEVHNYNDFTLEQSLAQAKICIGISSTTVIESIALGCYPIYVESNSLPLQIHDVFRLISTQKHVFKFSELQEFIENYNHVKFEKYLEILKSKMFNSNTLLKNILHRL